MSGTLQAPPEQTIHASILYLSRLLREHFRSTLAEEGLFAGQQEFLIRIKCRPGISPSQLAKDMDLSLASVSVSIKRLEKANFIERRENRADARSTMLFLTPHGQKVQSRIRKNLRDVEHKLTGGMTGAETAQLLSLLERGIANMGGLDGTGKAPMLFDGTGKKQ